MRFARKRLFHLPIGADTKPRRHDDIARLTFAGEHVARVRRSPSDARCASGISFAQNTETFALIMLRTFGIEQWGPRD